MRILLIAYDNGSYIHWFPQGIAYIAAALREAGHDVVLYLQDIHHYPEEHLRAYLDVNRFDVVGLGLIAGYWQYRKLKEISRAINGSRQRPFYMLGGFGPSADQEYFLEISGADVAVYGEGEITVVELLDALAEKRALSQVAGLAYRDGDKIFTTQERPVVEDLDSIPLPAYDMFPMEVYRLTRFAHVEPTDFALPVLSGRGCTFRCAFCYRMDKGFRPRSAESVLEEVAMLQKNYGITYICFNDELLMNSKERAIEFSETIIKSGLKFKWSCCGRLNYAVPEVLKAMKEAGCVIIAYGIEAMDNNVLKQMKKGLRVDQIHSGIEATLESGISPGFNILFGNIGDTRETLMKGVEFLLKYDDQAQIRTIRPVTPYPGSPLYYTAIEKGLLKDCRDFYENKHVNSDLLSVNFTDLTDEEFHEALMDANRRLLENYHRSCVKKMMDETEDLYIRKNAGFRGFRQS